MIGDKAAANEILKENDATFYVRKQRNGTGKLPSKMLWFDLASKQFRDSFAKPIRKFVSGDPVMSELNL